MNKFFRRLTLQAKLLLIGLIPFCFLVYLTIKVYNEKTERLELYSNYKLYIQESANISRLIKSLQEERKYSFDYALVNEKQDKLLLQRPKTNLYIDRLKKAKDPTLAGFTEYTNLARLQDIRNKVDSLKVSPNDVMHYYSNAVFRMNTLNTLPPANTPHLKPLFHDLMAHKILREMTTYLGIMNSNIYNVLHTRKYMIETLMGSLGTYDIYKSYEEELNYKASPKVLEEYKTVSNTTALKPTLDYINALFKSFKFDESLDAKEWWSMSDEGITEIEKLQDKIIKRLEDRVNLLYDQEKRSRSNTLLFLVLALAAIVISVAYIGHVISKSLKELQLAAEKIADGETGIYIKKQSNDAVGSLANSISKIDQNNQVLANAAVSIGQNDYNVDVHARSGNDVLGNAIIQMKNDLQNYNLKMEMLVEERTEELARSNDDLRQFAHVASHDLKEPLRKISLFSKILMDEQETLTEKGKLYLSKIRHASQRMTNMIEGVLAYSTVTVNEPKFEKVDLNKILEGVVSDLELAIIQKEATINYKNLPVIHGIQLQMHQVFYNLINNAIKFSKADVPPVINITSRIVDRPSGKKGVNNQNIPFAHITITDNGIGFNPDFTERMFGVFFRLNSKDDYEGTGLGLALCRKIVHRHGGEIYAEGQEGKGSSFHIVLPV